MLTKVDSVLTFLFSNPMIRHLWRKF